MGRLDKISSFKMTRSQQRKSKLKTQISRKTLITQSVEFYEDNSDFLKVIKAIESSPITSQIIRLDSEVLFNNLTPELTYDLKQSKKENELPEDVVKFLQMPSMGSPILRKFKRRARDYIPTQLISDKEQPQKGQLMKLQLTPINQQMYKKPLSMKSQEFIKIKDKNNSDLRPCKTASIQSLNTRSNSLMEKRKKLLNITVEEMSITSNDV